MPYLGNSNSNNRNNRNNGDNLPASGGRMLGAIRSVSAHSEHDSDADTTASESSRHSVVEELIMTGPPDAEEERRRRKEEKRDEKRKKKREKEEKRKQKQLEKVQKKKKKKSGDDENNNSKKNEKTDNEIMDAIAKESQQIKKDKDKNKDKNKNVKQLFIICLISVSTIKFFFHAFVSAYLPFYMSNYLELNDFERKAELTLAFYYWAFLFGKIIAPIALHYVNLIILCWIYFISPFVISILFYILQFVYKDNYNSTTFFILILIIYCVLAISISASFCTLFAVCDAITPITAFVGTLIVLTFGAGNAAGGYGGALILETFGYQHFPLLAMVTSGLQLVLVVVQIICFYKVIRSRKN